MGGLQSSEAQEEAAHQQETRDAGAPTPYLPGRANSDRLREPSAKKRAGPDLNRHQRREIIHSKKTRRPLTHRGTPRATGGRSGHPFIYAHIHARRGARFPLSPALKPCLAVWRRSTEVWPSAATITSHAGLYATSRQVGKKELLSPFYPPWTPTLAEPQNGKAIPDNCNPIPPCDNPVPLRGNFIQRGAKHPLDNNSHQSQTAHQEPLKAQDFPDKCTAAVVQFPQGAVLTPW